MKRFARIYLSLTLVIGVTQLAYGILHAIGQTYFFFDQLDKLFGFWFFPSLAALIIFRELQKPLLVPLSYMLFVGAGFFGGVALLLPGGVYNVLAGWMHAYPPRVSNWLAFQTIFGLSLSIMTIIQLEKEKAAERVEVDGGGIES